MGKDKLNQAKSFLKFKKYDKILKLFNNKNLDFEEKEILLKTYVNIGDDRVKQLAFELCKNDSKEALNILKTIYFKEEKYDEMKKIYDDYYKRGIIDEKVNLRFEIDYYDKKEDFNKSIDMCDKLLLKNSNDKDLKKKKEKIIDRRNKKFDKLEEKLKLKEYDEILEFLNGKTLKNEEKSLLLNIYKENDKTKAKELAIDMCKNGSKEGLKYLSKTYKKQGKLKDLKEDYDKYYDEGKISIKTYLKYQINYYKEIGDYNKSIEICDTLLKKNPDSEKLNLKKDSLLNIRKSYLKELKNQMKSKNYKDVINKLETKTLKKEEKNILLNAYMKQNDCYDKALDLVTELHNSTKNKEEKRGLIEKYGHIMKVKFKQEQKEKVRIYAAGMFAIQEKRYEDAIRVLNRALKLDENDVKTLNGLGKAYFELKDYKEARKCYLKAVERDKENKQRSITKLADTYLYDKMYHEAEFLYSKAVQINEKNKSYNSYEYSKLGEIYTVEEKYDLAEENLKKGIEQANNVKNEKDYFICSMKMSAMLAKQGHDEEAKEMYEKILLKCPKDMYFKHDEKDTKKHILKHMINDTKKGYHGVFNIDPIEIYNNIDFTKLKKNPVYLHDIYCMEYENCGYEGGKKGSNKQLDYITIVTEAFSDKIITMYPSEKVDFICKTVEEKSNLEILKKLVGENQILRQRLAEIENNKEQKINKDENVINNDIKIKEIDNIDNNEIQNKDIINEESKVNGKEEIDYER